MDSVSGKAYDIPILKRIMGYTLPYKGIFAATTALTVFLAFISPARPWLIQHTLDNYIFNNDMEGLVNMTLLMIALLMVEAIAQFYQMYYASWLGQTVIKDLRISLYKHVVQFRLKYFDGTPIGTLVTRLISDIETISDIFAEGILTIIGDLLKLLVVIIVMFWTDWKLTLFSLSSLPILLVATSIFKNAVKAAFHDVRTQVAHLNAFVQEHITGMSVVQIFNREEQELKNFRKINAEHRDAHIRSVWAYSIFFPVVEVLAALSIALMMWWGAKDVLAGNVSFGVLVAFILYIHMLYRPIRQLADRFNTLQMGMVSSERVFKILDTKEFIQHNGSLNAGNTKGEIEFKNVWFAYNAEKNLPSEQTDADKEDAEWVLKDASFKVNPGEMVALVGPTGAGKTSIISLLNRFYELSKGSILIDGHDIREYEIGALRKSIGVVLQDVFLFSDTIMNNITLRDNSISPEKVREAAKIVGADDFINRMPGKYNYNVMERGTMLSVGQRQLIAFIRAYVYNPRILVLDEATSSIDVESEQLIQKAISKLTKGRTSIIIAHRLSTIQKADKIIVIDKGEIKETGNHQELLEQNGIYRRLYEIQFAGQFIEG